MEIASLNMQCRWRNKQSRRQFVFLCKRMTNLQSCFRGRAVRGQMPRKVRQVSSRVLKANMNAKRNPTQTLGGRTMLALEVITHSPSLEKITSAIRSLEVATRHSKKCCYDFCHAGAAEILFLLVQNCNRSLPHVELIQYTLRTLVNVARHHDFMFWIATMKGGAIPLDLLQSFRDKESVFYPAVTLLEKSLNYNEELKRHVRASDESFKRLRHIYSLCLKKASVQDITVMPTTRRQRGKKPSHAKVPNHVAPDHSDFILGIRALFSESMSMGRKILLPTVEIYII